MPYPNLIIAGPPKTGTTSIYDWLSKHPNVCASRIKETQYFFHKVTAVNREANYIEHGLTRYESLFRCDEKRQIVFEATPDYFYSDTAFDHLDELPTLQKIVFIHRNPAERLFSEYRFHKFKTKHFDGDFRAYAGYQNGDFLGEPFQRGKTTDLLEKWTSKYGKEKILVYGFEALSQPLVFMEKLCTDLNLDSSFYRNFDFQIKNETLVVRNRNLHALAYKIKKQMPSFLANKLQPVYRLLNQSTPPTMSEDDQFVLEKLKEAYADQMNPTFLIS